MVPYKNRWTFFDRNWTREKFESGMPIISARLQAIGSIAHRVNRKARQLSPRNLLLRLILRDVAHF
jgi:hypothetical protein